MPPILDEPSAVNSAVQTKMHPVCTRRGTQFSSLPAISGGRGGWPRSCLASKIVGLFVGTSSTIHTTSTIISIAYVITLNPYTTSQRGLHHIDKGWSFTKSTVRHTRQGYACPISCPILLAYSLPTCLHISRKLDMVIYRLSYNSKFTDYWEIAGICCLYKSCEMYIDSLVKFWHSELNRTAQGLYRETRH